MDATEATADRIGYLYREQLRNSARRAEAATGEKRRLRGLLRLGRELQCLTMTPENESGTWLWGDLRLGDESAIDERSRPFSGTEAMDTAMIEGWRNRIASNDIVVVVGDAGIRGGVGAGQRELWTGLPGRKMLVAGDRDIDDLGGIDRNDYEQIALSMLIPGSPAMAVTHVPMTNVPAGMVNIHAQSAADQRQGAALRMDVSADALGFEPMNVEELRQRAQWLTSRTRRRRRRR